MRAWSVRALFYGLIAVFLPASTAMAACEDTGDCASESVVTQTAELSLDVSKRCALDDGRRCYAPSRIDEALDTILCGNGFDGGDCAASHFVEPDVGTDSPAALIAPVPQSEPDSPPTATNMWGADDDGC